MLRLKAAKDTYYVVRNKHHVTWFRANKNENPQTTLDEINAQLNTNYQFMTKHKNCNPAPWEPMLPSFPFFL